MDRTRLWRILAVKSRSPGPILSARGSIANIGLELCIRKINPAVSYKMNRTSKKVEWGSHLEGFCSSL